MIACGWLETALATVGVMALALLACAIVWLLADLWAEGGG